MQICLPNLRTPALTGFFLTLPFIILELLNRGFNANFPFSLFAFLWLLPAIFFATLTPILTYLRAGGKIQNHPLSLLTRIVILLLIGALWAGTIMDQMPCFLGVLNCD